MRDDDGFTLLHFPQPLTPIELEQHSSAPCELRHLAVMTPPSDRVFATVALLLQFRAQAQSAIIRLA